MEILMRTSSKPVWLGDFPLQCWIPGGCVDECSFWGTVWIHEVSRDVEGHMIKQYGHLDNLWIFMIILLDFQAYERLESCSCYLSVCCTFCQKRLHSCTGPSHWMFFLSTCAYEPIRITEVMSGNDLSVGLFAKLPKDANQIASFGNITGQKWIDLQHSTDDRWGASKCIGWAEETSWGGSSRELLPDKIMFPMFNYVQLPFEILDHDGI